MPTSIPLPQISFGKTKKRSQMCIVHTLDGRIEPKELEVDRSCILNHEASMGFLVDPDNQYRHDGNWVQLIWERSGDPLETRVDHDQKDAKFRLKGIYREFKALAEAKQYTAAKNNKANITIIFLVSIVCGTFLIIAAMKWLPAALGKGG